MQQQFKHILKSNKYLISGLFILLFVFLANSIDVSRLFHNYRLTRFEKTLQTKEVIIKTFTDSLLLHTGNRTLAKWVNANADDIDKLYEKYGIVLYVYNSNRLLYWTDNSIAIPDNNQWYDSSFVKTGNSYVVVNKKTIGSVTVVGLIDIYRKYPFENVFIKNGFHKSFHLNSNYSIFLESNSKGRNIYNSKGVFLFSVLYDKVASDKIKNVVLSIFIIVAIFLFLLSVRDRFKHKELGVVQFAVFAIIPVAIKFFTQVYKFPAFLYSLKIFNPEYFHYNVLIPSLGDLLLSVIIINYVIFIFYTKIRIKRHSNNRHLIFSILVWVIILMAYLSVSYRILIILITKSGFQIEAYDVLNLSVFSFVAYFIILNLFIGYILLLDKFFLYLLGTGLNNEVQINVKGIGNILMYKHLVTINVTLFICFLFVDTVIIDTKLVSPLFFALLFVLFWGYVRFLRQPGLSFIIILVAGFSVFTTRTIRKENFLKSIEESKTLAVNISKEKDPVAEMILAETINKIEKDTIIKDMLEQKQFNFNMTYNYIKQTYFSGYLSHYETLVTICNPYDNILIEGVPQGNCYTFFNSIIATSGVKTQKQELYFIKDNSGDFHYLITPKIKLSEGWGNVTIFIDLIYNTAVDIFGYPELLLKKPVGVSEHNKKLSYAKYNNNILAIKNGKFPYAYERSIYKHFDKEFDFFKYEGYNHLIYNQSNNRTVIVSKPSVNFYNNLISFTYIFFFLLTQTLILLIIGDKFSGMVEFRLDIKNKIMFSMLLILFVSFVFVGTGTIIYTYDKFNKEQIDLLSEKIQSIQMELEQNLQSLNDISQASPEYLNLLLIRLSNIFYADVNLYGKNGELIATSRKEIFDKKLTGNNINAIAYRELLLNKKATIVQKEQIGEMKYYSAYVPFFNGNKKLLAYLNLPYFTKENILKTELLKVSVAVINIYIFLIVLSIAIAVWLSDRLTQPLRMLQQRIQNIDLSKKNELIEYRGRDEIAELVSEYNRMLEALDKSARLLARSERESAWREMARQIAHEIKNPLTPMKLTIQLLERSHASNDDDFDERFDRATKMFIEQIDSLSSIASAFSQFATMPVARHERVNLTESIFASAQLYNNYDDTELIIEADKNREIFVKADKERLLQVFNNLIKNAIQATKSREHGVVKINISLTEEQVVVEVKDNGIGISEEMEDKIFQPNFTTKNSGKGLGLAIVKKIVEEFGGDIWFDSEMDKGSTFYVSLPLLS